MRFLFITLLYLALSGVAKPKLEAVFSHEMADLSNFVVFCDTLLAYERLKSTRLSSSPEVNAVRCPLLIPLLEEECVRSAEITTGVHFFCRFQRLEQKRAEHERQRAEQKQAFAAQVCLMELSISWKPGPFPFNQVTTPQLIPFVSLQMRALEAQHESEERELLGVPASAPTTPPRSDGDSEHVAFVDSLRHRSRGPSQYGNIGVAKTSAFREFANNSKSVPASRRHSGQEDDLLGFDKLTIGSSLAA